MTSEEIAALLSEKLGPKAIESKLGVVTPWTVVDPGRATGNLRFLAP